MKRDILSGNVAGVVLIGSAGAGLTLVLNNNSSDVHLQNFTNAILDDFVESAVNGSEFIDVGDMVEDKAESEIFYLLKEKMRTIFEDSSIENIRITDAPICLTGGTHLNPPNIAYVLPSVTGNDAWRGKSSKRKMKRLK
jgi:hypothetical protein